MAEPTPEIVVRVRYFAALVELAGRDEEALALPSAGATVAAVWDRVIALHPALGQQRPFVRVARNTDFVKDDARVEAGDVVAFLPPFSGG